MYEPGTPAVGETATRFHGGILVDAPDSESGVHCGREGSSPSGSTFVQNIDKG
jgi:hypothetical protein